MAWIDNFDLNSTATIYARTKTNDGMGGYTYTNTSRGSIKCAIWQLSAAEKIQGDRVKNHNTHKLVCDPNNNFQADDYIVVGSDTFKISTPNDILRIGDIMTIDMELAG
jgi:head-tail adaptor